MLAYDADGAEHRFTSGEDEDEKNVAKLLEELRYPPDRAGRYPAAAHAEPKLAYWMRTAGVTQVVAVINNDEGGVSPGRAVMCGNHQGHAPPSARECWCGTQERTGRPS